MNPWEALRLAANAIRAHKLRSALTTIGIMIGVMTVIGMLALIDGLNQMVASQLASIGSNTIYVQKFPWAIGREEQVQARKRENLTLDDFEILDRQLTLAEWVAPRLKSAMRVSVENRDLEATEVIGTTPDYQFVVEFNIAAGRQLSSIDVRQDRQVVMIGSTVARELFPARDPLNKTIQIGERPFEVIAVLEEKGTLLGSDQDNIAIIPVTTYTKFFSGPITSRGSKSITIAVKPDDPALIDRLRDEITTVLRRTRSLRPDEANDFSINTAEQLMDTYRRITSGVYGVMIGVTALALGVGGIGIMNIMFVSVSERTHEIGIRKAVGAKRRDILAQFLTEAVVLSCMGGVVGMVLGYAVAWAVSLATNLPAAVSWWSVVLGFGFSASVGVFFGWYPARRAALMNPVEALRYE